MPTYQYACTNPDGKHEFEVVQSFTDAAVAECPTCQAPVRKVYGSIGVVFKGSGFYRTDSRSGSSAESAKGSSESSSKESSKESSPAGSSAKESSSKGSSSATPSTPAPAASSGSGSKAAAS